MKGLKFTIQRDFYMQFIVFSLTMLVLFTHPMSKPLIDDTSLLLLVVATPGDP